MSSVPSLARIAAAEIGQVVVELKTAGYQPGFQAEDIWAFAQARYLLPVGGGGRSADHGPFLHRVARLFANVANRLQSPHRSAL